MNNLEKIIQEVSTRQITMYEGREPRADELLVGEILRLREELRKLTKEHRRLDTLLWTIKAK